jgi:hypothetical protein
MGLLPLVTGLVFGIKILSGFSPLLSKRRQWYYFVWYRQELVRYAG